MFYQPGLRESNADSALNSPRLRIFYPGGRAEWATLSDGHDVETTTLFFGSMPCWSYGEKIKSINHAIALASAYDVEKGFGKMKFLGEL